MPSNSSMGGGADGGGFGGSGQNNSGGFGAGGRNSGAGGDRLDQERLDKEQQRQQAGMYTADQRRLQMELNKALIDGDIEKAKQLQADIAHLNSTSGFSSSGQAAGIGGIFDKLIPNQGSVTHDGYYSLNDKRYAEKTYAAVTRGQYQDWEDRFLPKQRELMALAKDESLAKQQLARTDGLVANSLRQAQQGQDNQMARIGVTRKQNTDDNSLGLRQALMTAGTKNATRSHERDRQMGILTGADAGTREKLQTGGIT